MVVLQHVLLRTLCRSPQPFRNTALEGIHPPEITKMLFAHAENPQRDKLFEDLWGELVPLASYGHILQASFPRSYLKPYLVVFFSIIWACVEGVRRFKTGFRRLLALLNELCRTTPETCRLEKMKDGKIFWEHIFLLLFPSLSLYLGALLGARCSSGAFPLDWLEDLEDKDRIASLALH